MNILRTSKHGSKLPRCKTSLLIEMGYDIFVISERLGHENVSTTMDVYGHLYPDKQKSLAGDLARLKK